MKHLLLVPIVCLALLAIATELVAGVSVEAAAGLASVFRVKAVEIAYVVLFFGMLLVGLATGVWRTFAAP
ncbi:MAG: hypothetical protein H6Q87_1680, partial [candidate division NC10 bacterium]|nr:hypothetical protein [candidate division NC10 bacterium]